VQRYGWTASQYIETIVEHLFGIDYDHFNHRVRILPHLPHPLYGERISISNLMIPGQENARLTLSVLQTATDAIIEVSVSGEVPEGDLEIYLPVFSNQKLEVKDGQGVSIQILNNTEGLTNVAGIRVPLQENAKFQFYFK